MESGALGIIVANPTDLVKVRLQAEGKLPPGVPKRYSGALSAYSTIVRQVILVVLLSLFNVKLQWFTLKVIETLKCRRD